ncbi:MAG: helix-turn-helix transcriptional regulator [Cellulomonadaceae bacterium]|nr:helix-turn-helix transcriptional regulator [Cellulomonadaceae bacterium]
MLAQARRESGVTRDALAATSGVSTHTIAKIEQAAVTDPGFTLVATLAEALEVPLDQLIERARDTLRPR